MLGPILLGANMVSCVLNLLIFIFLPEHPLESLGVGILNGFTVSFLWTVWISK